MAILTYIVTVYHILNLLIRFFRNLKFNCARNNFFPNLWTHHPSKHIPIHCVVLQWTICESENKHKTTPKNFRNWPPNKCTASTIWCVYHICVCTYHHIYIYTFYESQVLLICQPRRRKCTSRRIKLYAHCIRLLVKSLRRSGCEKCVLLCIVSTQFPLADDTHKHTHTTKGMLV